MQGRFVNLSEIVTILKQSISDYDDGKLEYDEALGHLKFMLVWLVQPHLHICLYHKLFLKCSIACCYESKDSAA